jgi:energy-coupling factor transporter ATP-binding protein EcfA2
MIEFRGVTYSYPGTETPVLRNLSLEVEEGELLLVIGASGSGKSTLLRCLNGLVPHFYGGHLSGSVRVAGQDPEAQFVVDSVEDELAFSMENHNLGTTLMRKRIEEVLDQINIAHLRHRKINTLSGGEKQRVAIGAVLTLQPQVLVLDEPTSQLDPQSAEEVLTTLQKLNADLGLTVVLSEHRLERVVQYADRVLYLPGEGRRPVAGTPREVLAHVDLTPPLITLAKELQWQPMPLTIKEGRRFARSLSLPRVNGEAWKEPGSPKRSARDAIINVDDVWFSYDGLEALRGISLSVRPGELLALMGRNGSGKTTLLKQIVALLRPERGRVELWGKDTRGQEVQDIARRVGFVPQDPGSLLFADTLREELDFTLRSHGLPGGGYQDLLASLDLSRYENSYPRDLSGGERQRAALAAILVADPDIILLDEPPRGLDYYQKQSLSNFLAQKQAAGKSVVMSTHDVELVAQCADRVVIMGDGQIVVDGPAKQVMSSSMVFASQVNKLLRDERFVTVRDVLGAIRG